MGSEVQLGRVFFEWLNTKDVDIVCIQETKAQEEQLSDEVFSPDGYYRDFFDAQKKRLQWCSYL